MKLLVVAATKMEIAPAIAYLEKHFKGSPKVGFVRKNLTVITLVTGAGQTATAYALGRFLATNKIDLAINAGIAGSFTEKFQPGTVVHVASEQFGDLGAEDSDGSFLDAFELGLIEQNQPPFTNRKLVNPTAADAGFLPQAAGLTVQKVHGAATSIGRIKEKFHCEVESMEGAAFFYVCLLAKVAFLEIRAVSNYVEPRNRSNWKMELAIQNLNEVLIQIINTF